jgi:ribosomal protein S18 acetylase RimI-like enzyme
LDFFFLVRHFVAFHLPQSTLTSTPACYDMEEAKEAKVEAKRPAKAKAAWRNLSVNDIESLVRVADEIHPDLPESDEVFAERVKLFPEGCLALVEGEGDELCGYVISHPIRRRQPPALNSVLGEIAPDADQYYIHDLAILPKFRGYGLAQECLNKLFAIAKRFPTTCLVSVYGTGPFWGRFGFVPEEIDEVLEKKLLGYGDDAEYLERKNEKNERLNEDGYRTGVSLSFGS